MIYISPEDQARIAKQSREMYAEAVAEATATTEKLNRASARRHAEGGYTAVSPVPPVLPSKRYPIGVVILWSIACLALGFSFCALCLGCGPIVPTGSNTCCYGSTDPKVQECEGFLNGCTFIATQDDGGCGEMVCD